MKDFLISLKIWMIREIAEGFFIAILQGKVSKDEFDVEFVRINESIDDVKRDVENQDLLEILSHLTTAMSQIKNLWDHLNQNTVEETKYPTASDIDEFINSL